MITTDPIADFLTRIRNAIKAEKVIVRSMMSKMKYNIALVLKDSGYLVDCFVDKENGLNIPDLVVKIRYTEGTASMSVLERISRPGLRRYYGCDVLPEVLNGLGIAVVSTSQGIMSNKQAKKRRLGGEVLCSIY